MEILELQEFLRSNKQICTADLQLRYGMDYTAACKTRDSLIQIGWIGTCASGVYHAVRPENLHLRSFSKEELQQISKQLRSGDVRVLRRLTCFTVTRLSEIRFFDTQGTIEERMELMEGLGLVSAFGEGYRRCISNSDSLELFRLARFGRVDDDDD